MSEVRQDDAGGKGEGVTPCSCRHCGHEFAAVATDGHRVVCGDATDAATVATALDGNVAALCFTSPPYLDARKYDGGDLSVDNLAKFFEPIAGSVRVVAVTLGIMRREQRIIRYWDEYIDAAERVGFPLIAWNVWDKGAAGSIAAQSAMFALTHEWVFVFGTSRKLNPTRPTKRGGSVERVTRRIPDGSLEPAKDVVVAQLSNAYSVHHISAQQARNLDMSHPAMFPVALPQEYIKACTDIGDAVYEPFSGSGTTIIAAEHIGRVCYAIELSPAYVDVAVQRWQNFTGKRAFHEKSGEPFAR